MSLRAEKVGAFIDAVYAIAVTILALEIPGAIQDGEFKFTMLGDDLLEYVVTFAILFAFWLQHRRINALEEETSRGGLWMTACILMLVCLVPRATTLVFEFGEDVTFGAFKGTLLQSAGWTVAEAVDLFYVVVVVLVDLGLLVLLKISRNRTASDDLRHLQQTKATTTILLVFVVGASFLLPVENRYFLLVIPVVVFFEHELWRAVRWLRLTIQTRRAGQG